MNLNPIDWGVYIITDRYLSPGREHILIADEALKGGADAVQVRDKDADSLTLLKSAREIISITNRYGVPLIINDYLDLAVAVQAQGVHLGSEDCDYLEVKPKIPPGMIFGASAGNMEEVAAAIRAGADYIGLGPIFEARGTKADAGEPVGPGLIEKTRRLTDVPLIAIGGMDHHNAPMAIAAGACGVAVISSVVCAENISESTKRLKEIVEGAKARYG